MSHVDDETFTIEMFWKCRFCGTKCPGLQGKEDESLKCTQCGAQKADEPWLMPDDIESAPVITDAKLLTYANAGPNWRCPSCGNDERTQHDVCSVCGEDRNGKQANSAPTAVAAPAKPTPSARPATPRTPTPPPTAYGHWQDEAAVSPFTRSSLQSLVLGGGIIVGIGLLVFLLYLAFSPSKGNATVRNLHWQRTERLFEEHTYSGQGWASQMPAGAFNTRCETRLRGYENCRPYRCDPYQHVYECNCRGGERERCNPHPVNYDCNCRRSEEQCNPQRVCTSNGNGSATCRRVWDTCRGPEICERCTRTEYEWCERPRVCERCEETRWHTCYERCPVNEEYCSYQYNQWDRVTTQTRSGNDHAPRWPGLVAQHNRQRVERDQSYSVTFVEDGGSHRWTQTPSTEQEFLRYDLGQRYRAEWNAAGSFRLLRRLP